MGMTAHVLESVGGGIFETRHNHLSNGHILATVAHNFEFIGLGLWYIAH